MLDVPVESAHIWLGLALVSATMVGLAVRVPTAPPPDAEPVARTVDSVATSPFEAMGRQPLDAAQIRLGSDRVGVRSSGGTDHASFAFDSVVPVFEDGPVRTVLAGRPPASAFDDPDAFAAALDRLRTRDARWLPAPEVLIVRRVNWGDVNATLVGA